MSTFEIVLTAILVGVTLLALLLTLVVGESIKTTLSFALFVLVLSLVITVPVCLLVTSHETYYTKSLTVEQTCDLEDFVLENRLIRDHLEITSYNKNVDKVEFSCHLKDIPYLERKVKEYKEIQLEKSPLKLHSINCE